MDKVGDVKAVIWATHARHVGYAIYCVSRYQSGNYGRGSEPNGRTRKEKRKKKRKEEKNRRFENRLEQCD